MQLKGALTKEEIKQLTEAETITFAALMGWKLGIYKVRRELYICEAPDGLHASYLQYLSFISMGDACRNMLLGEIA